MHVSVVIPTFNRSRLLPETIPALANQRTRADVTYEVIFVSNGSTDSSDQILKATCQQYPEKFRYFYIQPTGGPSAPRNVGIRAAKGDAIVIIDDDVLPEENMVQSFAEFHAKYPEPHQAAIGEVYVPRGLLDDPMSLFHAFPYDEVRKLQRLGYLHFWTCCVSVKRQFMLDSGMFDEAFLYYEDIVCGHRLESNGMELHFCPTARGQHLHQMTPAGLASKGLFLGRWLYPFLERIPDPAAKERMGVLSMDIRKTILLRRIAGRIKFRVIDNPVTMKVLEALGARNPKRSKVTDYYYSLIFRRNILLGYHEARRSARQGQQLNLRRVDSPLADRGDR